MQTINKNIRFLREKAELTQKALAKRLNVKPPVIGSYEEGRSIPPIPISIKIAQQFDVSLDQLLMLNLRALPNQLDQNTIVRGSQILTISVDSAGNENVELVNHKASAGYVRGYYDLEYIKELPKISIPFLSKSATYRAFEITGQSMLPVKSGDIIVGSYLDNLQNMKRGKTYVIVSRTGGIVYKRFLESFSNHLLLISDNSTYDPFTIPLADVLEVWGFATRITQQEEQPEPTLRYLEKIMKIKQDKNGTTV